MRLGIGHNMSCAVCNYLYATSCLFEEVWFNVCVHIYSVCVCVCVCVCVEYTRVFLCRVTFWHGLVNVSNRREVAC